MRYFLFVFLFTISTASVAQPKPISKGLPQYKKGQQLMQQGLFLQAIAAFKKSIAADKRFDSSHLMLASLYLRTSQTDSAVQVLNAAIKSKSNFTAAHIMLGMVYRDYIKNSNVAMMHYTNAAKLDSTNKETWYSLAWCCNDLKKYSDAIGYAIKALNVDNNYKAAYNEIGHAVNASKIYKQGIEIFRNRLNISVNEQPIYYSGLCYIELKDKEGATGIYNELVKLKSTRAEFLKKKIDAMK
jgi:tetratricopeptide (TPR) repeat protein